jgi:undecaprenyl diphosphate synthase
MITPKNIPQHVAIIMDGNGRWAKRRGLPRLAGHRAGAKTVDKITSEARKTGIKVLTLYAFSTENWKRPKEEITGLFGLLEKYLGKEKGRLTKNGIRLNVIGDISALPGTTRRKIEEVMKATKGNDAMVLNIALNYGARDEILRAVRDIAEDVGAGRLKASEIDEEIFSNRLYTKGLPDPDLLIRTSGEYRVSNFLLWQISYAELYITDKLWPDFQAEDFRHAIKEYQNRERRYGG